MTHRGPFQPLLFCDSVILRGGTGAPGMLEQPATSGAVRPGPAAEPPAPTRPPQLARWLCWDLPSRCSCRPISQLVSSTSRTLFSSKALSPAVSGELRYSVSNKEIKNRRQS